MCLYYAHVQLPVKFPGGTEIHKSLEIYLKGTNYNALLRHMCTQMPVVLDTKAKLLLWLCSNVGHSLPVQFYIFYIKEESCV